MAKKISLAGTIKGNPQPIADEAVVKIGDVNYTGEGARHGNSISTAVEIDEVFPVVDAHTIEPSDANDGTENGEQDSFKMPPFANGPDTRKRHSY